ncbi:hypothetical protein E2C01_006196 [Portunus trituberculatus]|uniref:Uncharacterized protein n=1 Tax=Portunus trituberculatus TaxID=210409 RepID=A0A5B7CUL4_PORTR|nr:hypothetical protein [Portunus trituberculatus]
MHQTESPHVSCLRTDAGFVEESSGTQAVVVVLVVRVVVKGMNLAAQVLFRPHRQPDDMVDKKSTIKRSCITVLLKRAEIHEALDLGIMVRLAGEEHVTLSRLDPVDRCSRY